MKKKYCNLLPMAIVLVLAAPVLSAPILKVSPSELSFNVQVGDTATKLVC